MGGSVWSVLVGWGDIGLVVVIWKLCMRIHKLPTSMCLFGKGGVVSVCACVFVCVQ